MKRKPVRNIPDFSRKPKGFNPSGHNPTAQDQLKQQAPVAPKAMNVKPPVMQPKGQRGGGSGG